MNESWVKWGQIGVKARNGFLSHNSHPRRAVAATDNDQRIIMTLVLAVTTILIMLLIRRNARVRERDARRARRRGRELAYEGFEENLYDNESDLTFRRLFRMSKLCFTALLNALDDDDCR